MVTESGDREHFFIFSGTQFNQRSIYGPPRYYYRLDDRDREQERSFETRRMVSAGGGRLSSKLCFGQDQVEEEIAASFGMYDHREFYRDWWAITCLESLLIYLLKNFVGAVSLVSLECDISI